MIFINTASQKTAALAMKDARRAEKYEADVKKHAIEMGVIENENGQFEVNDEQFAYFSGLVNDYNELDTITQGVRASRDGQTIDRLEEMESETYGFFDVDEFAATLLENIKYSTLLHKPV